MSQSKLEERTSLDSLTFLTCKKGGFRVKGSVLLIGSSGFIGSSLARAARNSGFEVTGMARASLDRRDIELDLSMPDWLDSAIRRVQPENVVFALGGKSSSGPAAMAKADWQAFQAGILFAEFSLCEAKRVVFFGSASEFGPSSEPHDETSIRSPADSYGSVKVLESDFMLSLRASGVRVTVLRPTSVYGPSQSGGMLIPQALGAALTGSNFEIRSPLSVRDFLHVQDLTNAVLGVMQADISLPSAINLSSGFKATVEEVVRTINHLVGADEGKVTILQGCEDGGSSDVLLLDSSLAFKILNWRAEIPLREGLSSLVG
jgi:nucleoside-diphosphate-sugar epimerase